MGPPTSRGLINLSCARKSLSRSRLFPSNRLGYQKDRGREGKEDDTCIKTAGRERGSHLYKNSKGRERRSHLFKNKGEGKRTTPL
jgi:hypothetical protein